MHAVDVVRDHVAHVTVGLADLPDLEDVGVSEVERPLRAIGEDVRGALVPRAHGGLIICRR